MIHRITTAVIAVWCPVLAHAQAPDCRPIKDPAARLACYDGKTASAKVRTEDPQIARARAAIGKALRDPGSARYANIKVATGGDGSKAVCGTVAGRNAFGGYSTPQLFVYDGKIGRVLLSADGPNNPTNFDRLLIGAMLGESLKVYDKYCK